MAEEPALEFNRQEGWLWKTGSNNKGWRERYFVLSGGRLTYYKSEKTESSQGTIDLFDCDHISKAGGRKGYGFDIFVPGRVYNISADTEQEQSTWMTSINTTLAVIKSLPSDSPMVMGRSAAGRESVSSVSSSVAGFINKRRGRKDSEKEGKRSVSPESVGVPARREDAVLHSLLEAEVDALRAKVAMLESSLTGSQTSYSQLQQDMSQCKREHSLTISSLKEEATRLTLQVSSLEQAKGQLEMMNDSYKVQLQEKDEYIEGLQEEVTTLEEETTHAQHELEEAQQLVTVLRSQSRREADQISKLEGEVDALREKLVCEAHQRQSVEEELAELKSKPELLSIKGEDLQQSSDEEVSHLKAEMASKDKKLDGLFQTTAVLEGEIVVHKEKARLLQIEKDKAVSDLIALRKSHRNIERKLSESEEHRLSPNRAERVFHSPRHSPMPPERTVSEQVLAEAEKRAEIATRVLQEVQLERDSLKAQLQKQVSSPIRSVSNGGTFDLRALSPAPLRSKATPTTAVSCSDSPPKKPKRPPDELLGKYRAELGIV